MKKVLCYLSAAALMVSCTNELLEQNPSAENGAKGVTFQVLDETRGMVNGEDFSSFFFAEQDRVDIFANNVKNATSFNAPFTYKATKSQGNPLLTGIDDVNTLYLKDMDSDPETDEVGQFLVTYPTGQTVNYNPTDKKFTIIPTNDLTTQTMKDGFMNFDSRLLYDYVTAAKENFYESAGEKLALDLKSPLYMIRFVLNDIDSYSSEFGTLQNVTLTSTKNALSYANSGSSIIVTENDIANVGGTNYLKSTLDLTYPALTEADLIEIPAGSGTTYIRATCKNEGGVYYLTSSSIQAIVGGENRSATQIWATNGTSVAAEIGNELSYGGTIDDAFIYDQTTKEVAYQKGDGDGIVKKAQLNFVNTTAENGKQMNMFVMPAARNGEAENLIVTYKFDKVDLSYVKSVSGDWNANATGKLSLTIADQFPYILTKGTSGNSRTLIVNKGKLSDILNADATAVAWTDEYASTGSVDFTQVYKIVINTGVDAFEDADWTVLNKFTNAASLIINNSTTNLVSVSGMNTLRALSATKIATVDNGAFGSNASNIHTLSLNSVTSYKDNKPFAVLKSLNLSKYTFTESDEAAALFFNNDVKSTLKNVDLSSVTSLAPVFGYERMILFTDYTALESVKLNNTKTVISANEFKGCTSLTTVEGVVDMTTAKSAFEGCSNLSTVNVFSTDIPERGFAGSAVKNILKDNAEIIPTTIGKEAFLNNTAIEALDLRQVTSLGIGAFQEANHFVGMGTNGVVTLNVETVPTLAFTGTIVKRFQLKEATVVEGYALNSTQLLQVKLRKAATCASNFVDARKAQTDLFVNNLTEANKYEGFRSVTVEDFDWTE